MKAALLLAAVLVLAALPAPAAAHTLARDVAADRARAEAHATIKARRIEARVSVRSCERREAHVQDCRVRYRFTRDGRLTGTRCYHTMRVRLTGPALSVRVLPTATRCT